MIFKEKFEEYTEAEFLEFLRELIEGGRELSPDEYEDFTTKGLLHFAAVTGQPDGYDALVRPPKTGQDDSAEGILKEVKEWRARNNKPGLKPE